MAAIPAALIEALLDAAFGTDRHRRTAYRLREGASPIPELSFAAVAEAGGGLLGTVQSWPVVLEHGGARHPLVLVGPVAVLPTAQRRGIGQMLTAAVVAGADRDALPPLTLIGDPDYYGRFGFSAAGTGGWTLPGPFERHRLLLRAAAGANVPDRGALGPAMPALRPVA